MIPADYKSRAFHPDFELHARIVDDRVEVSSQNSKSGSYTFAAQGLPQDVFFTKDNFYALWRCSQRLFLYVFTVYGFLLHRCSLGPSLTKKPILQSVSLGGRVLVCVLNDGQLIVVHENTVRYRIECSAVITQVLDFCDYLLIKLANKQLLVYTWSEQDLVLKRKVDLGCYFVLAYDERLFLDDGQVLDINFAYTEGAISFYKVKQHDIWFIRTNSCEQHLTLQSLLYFFKHLLFGFSVNFETKSLEKFKLGPDWVVEFRGLSYALREAQRLAGVIDMEELVDFDAYGGLIIAYARFRGEFYLFAADVANQYGVVIYTSDTQIRYYKDGQQYVSLYDLKDRLAYHSLYDLYYAGKLQYSYDYPILAVIQAKDCDFYALTQFNHYTKIYLRYEIIFEAPITLLSMAVCPGNILVASDGSFLHYFFEGFYAKEPMLMRTREHMFAKADQLFFVSEFGARKVKSEMFEFIKQVCGAIADDRPVEFKSAHFLDQELLVSLFDFAVTNKKGLSENTVYSLMSTIFQLFSAYSFMNKILEYRGFTHSSLGQLTLEQFKNADDYNKVFLFRVLQMTLYTDAFRDFALPYYTTDLNQRFLLSLLTLLYYQQNYRLFILLSIYAGFSLSLILEQLFGEYNRLRRQNARFLKILAKKIKVISLRTLEFSTQGEMQLKEFLIALYDLFELNPINYEIQSLSQTNPARVYHLGKRQFLQLQISKSAEKYFSQFSECFASTRACEVQEGRIQYSFIRQEPEQQISLQATQYMEVASDEDNWGQTERKIKRFKIKTQK